jgi:hypothetical protein
MQIRTHMYYGYFYSHEPIKQNLKLIVHPPHNRFPLLMKNLPPSLIPYASFLQSPTHSEPKELFLVFIPRRSCEYWKKHNNSTKTQREVNKS